MRCQRLAYPGLNALGDSEIDSYGGLSGALSSMFPDRQDIHGGIPQGNTSIRGLDLTRFYLISFRLLRSHFYCSWPSCYSQPKCQARCTCHRHCHHTATVAWASVQVAKKVRLGRQSSVSASNLLFVASWPCVLCCRFTFYYIGTSSLCSLFFSKFHPKKVKLRKMAE